jgi:hypothetical protein
MELRLETHVHLVSFLHAELNQPEAFLASRFQTRSAFARSAMFRVSQAVWSFLVEQLRVLMR